MTTYVAALRDRSGEASLLAATAIAELGDGTEQKEFFDWARRRISRRSRLNNWDMHELVALILVGLLVHELGRRAVRDEPPPVDDHDAVGELLCLVEQVRGEHDGHPVRLELADVRPGQPPGSRVEARGRLVEEHDLGTTDQRECERQALLLPAGEVAEAGPAGVREPDTLEQPVGWERVGVEAG
jgi:hypothetical protein